MFGTDGILGVGTSRIRTAYIGVSDSSILGTNEMFGDKCMHHIRETWKTKAILFLGNL